LRGLDVAFLPQGLWLSADFWAKSAPGRRIHATLPPAGGFPNGCGWGYQPVISHLPESSQSMIRAEPARSVLCGDHPEVAAL